MLAAQPPCICFRLQLLLKFIGIEPDFSEIVALCYLALFRYFEISMHFWPITHPHLYVGKGNLGQNNWERDLGLTNVAFDGTFLFHHRGRNYSKKNSEILQTAESKG